jgi:hypothetical protein
MALDEERTRKQFVLLPVRLDDAMSAVAPIANIFCLAGACLDVPTAAVSRCSK